MKPNIHFWSHLFQFLEWGIRHKFLRKPCLVTFFFRKLAVYQVMCKNIVDPDRRKMTIWRMRIACWVTRAINTHSEYVIFIAFPLQQWLHERASMLRYTSIGCIYHNSCWTTRSDMWQCMTSNLLKFQLQIISNKFFKRRMIYIAYCTEHSVSMTNYTLENNIDVWPLFLITQIFVSKTQHAFVIRSAELHSNLCGGEKKHYVRYYLPVHCVYHSVTTYSS
jgi:hypothetical protein